jgi:hypothetical protein
MGYNARNDEIRDNVTRMRREVMSYSFIGDNMPILKTPRQVVVFVSLILALVAWLSVFAGVPYIGGHPSILLTLAYIVLALGCVL